MEEKNLISILILAYNIDKYIVEAVESVINQTYQELDIVIIINGKSTDNTEKIAKTLCKKDHRIRLVYNLENSHLSDGRMIGLRTIKGDYFMIMDGDDLLHEKACEKLINHLIAENADAIVARPARFITTSPFEQKQEDCFSVQKYSSKEYLPLLIWHMKYITSYVKLFRSSIFFDNNIEFLKGIHIGEDIMASILLLSHSNLVLNTEEVLYGYRFSLSSDSNTPSYEKFKNAFRVHLFLYSDFEKRMLFHYKDIKNSILSSTYIHLYYLLTTGGLKAFKDFPLEISRLLSSNDLREGIIKKYIKQWPVFYYSLHLFRFNKYIGHIIVTCFFSMLRKTKRKLCTSS